MMEIAMDGRIFMGVFAVLVFLLGRIDGVPENSTKLAVMAITNNVMITLIAAALAVLAAVGRAPW